MTHLRRRLMGALIGALLVGFCVSGCGSGNSTNNHETPQENPVPSVLALSPGSATPGITGLLLTVNGSNFVSGARVQWNGGERPTTFVNSSQVTGSIAASDVAAAGTALITVSNPAPGGGTSNSVTFSVEPDTGMVWRTTELALNAQATYTNPFTDNSVSAQFDGPAGQRLILPGFYDGSGVWRVRFTPTASGAWHYQTVSANPADKGLHGISGSLNVAPASSKNLLYQHGGFLRVSDNHRYLTYTDGTPFFWLGDVWWFAPSSLMPLDGDNPAFKILVDKRSSQNYSVVQMAFQDAGWGHEWCCDENSTMTLAQQHRANPAYWQLVDRYFAYAQDHGLLPVIGLPGGTNDLTLDQWKFLWTYVIARYAATPVAFLIMMEYNADNDPQRVTLALALGQHIKDSDPYKRALTVHAWAIWVEGEQAWTQPWYDFMMVQGGHWSPPLLAPSASYQFAYNNLPARPMVDAESAFEGILGYGGSPNGVVGPEQTRRAAYYSIQSGGFGYTYGAHGLWYPTQSATDDTFWADWGVSPPWWIAKDRPAGAQMQYLRALYESANWWELEPRFGSVTTADGSILPDSYQPLAKAAGDNVYVVWFPYGEDANAQFTLRLQAVEQATFNAKWFDPQTGTSTPLQGNISCVASACALPARPNSEDWVLVLTAAQ